MSTSTAYDVATTYQVAKDVFVLGSLSKGVTVYQQQCRALNLAWALIKLNDSGERPLEEVAVIGGGVAGLTLCAALMSISSKQVSLFEQTWDLCPLQQGSETRWLHPELYDWPAMASRRPGAGMQVLDWKTGRAADVASTMLKTFAARCEINATQGRPEPEVHLGLGHLRIDAKHVELDWVGRLAVREGRHFRAGAASGQRRRFGTIIIAGGFGMEADQPVAGSIASASYWRNDTLGQPVLTGARHTFIVSGHGDGGVVDLCRLTIERFRQDTILEELFGKDLESVEEALRLKIGAKGGRLNKNVKQLLDTASAPISDYMTEAMGKLRARVRKDARVILHVRKPSGPWRVDALFENKSSFLNRTLLYLLYNVGAFDISLDPLEQLVARHNIPSTHVIQRHGTDTVAHLLGLFSDPSAVAGRLKNIKDTDPQSSDMFCDGFFPRDPG